MSEHVHDWLCEDKKIDWCTICHVERPHANYCDGDGCEECCEHGDIPECGFCIDCGKQLND